MFSISKTYIKNIICLFLFISLSNRAFSRENQSNDQKLSSKNVIDSALKNYPKIISFYEKVAVKEGGVLENEGFFDIKIKNEYQDKSRGYFDGKSNNIYFEKQNSILGSQIYGGYRKSFKDFPSYEGNQITNDRGEYRIGTKFSLLQNNSIDQGRLDLITSKLELAESKVQLQKIKYEIQRDTIKSYWNWVIAGHIYKIYKELYDLADQRNEQLKIRFKKGDIAEITLIENKRNVLNRKTSMQEAKNDFDNSAIYLSLFYRDESGNPKVPSEKQLPEIFSKPQEIVFSKSENDINDAYERRPELQIIKIQKEQEKNNLKQAENLYKPKLDLDIEASKDYGAGQENRNQSNNSIKLNFEIPLQQRKARGKITQSRSKLNSIKYEEKLYQETIANEIKQIKNSLNNVVNLYYNIEQELGLSETLEKAEKERFKQGSSDFFLINIREQDTARNKISKLLLINKYQSIRADYQVAIFNFDQ